MHQGQSWRQDSHLGSSKIINDYVSQNLVASESPQGLLKAEQLPSPPLSFLTQRVCSGA